MVLRSGWCGVQFTALWYSQWMVWSAVYCPVVLPVDGVECSVRGLLEKYPTFGREKETGLLGALDT